MDKLIEALQIFLKYENPVFPTGCEHDELFVYISPDIISDEDKEKLDELGFFANDENEYFSSFRYGSA